MKQCTKCCQVYPEWNADYFFSKGIRNGEIKLRSECKKCTAKNNENYRKSLPLEVQKENSRKFGQRYKEKHSVEKVREAQRLCSKKWRKNNPEKTKNIYKKYRATQKYRINKRAQERKRDCVKSHACPRWADLTLIKQKYQESLIKSKETGILYSVDHIDPLTHDLVCGLHISCNLRVIPLLENKRKRNRFKPYIVEFSPSQEGFVVRYAEVQS